jgi:apolipoprotein N-acyltransferase
VSIKRIKGIVFLLVAFLVLLVSNGRWFTPAMVWAYPVFMLRFSRINKPLTGYLMIAFAMAIANQISFLNFVSSDPSYFLYYLPALLGPMIAVPYLIDAMIRQKSKSFITTLVFPATYVVVEYLYSLNPFGGTGVLGYTQYQFTLLTQIASITGVLGITFLITWTGSVINWCYDEYRSNRSPIKNLAVYIIVMVTVFVFGGVRLILPSNQETVYVAGLHVYDLRGDEGTLLFKSLNDDLDEFREMSDSIMQQLFDATRKEAKNGAKIVVWNEIAPLILPEDEQRFIHLASELARQEKIYLVTSPYVRYLEHDKLDENKILMFDPNGDLILTHFKFGGNILEGSIPGDKNLQFVDTEYGRLSGVICWDQDFPQVLRQIGQNDVDIILAPTADWLEITPLHSAVGYFRAVENGASLVRQNVNGLSIIVDPKGRILTSMNHFTSDEWVMVAQVPIQGVRTVYSSFGDFLVWICGFFIVSMIIINHKKTNY